MVETNLRLGHPQPLGDFGEVVEAYPGHALRPIGV
jgi:hypothetical protein